MREQQIAYIDLSSGEIKKKPIPDSVRRMYLGGRGIDVYLLVQPPRARQPIPWGRRTS